MTRDDPPLWRRQLDALDPEVAASREQQDTAHGAPARHEPARVTDADTRLAREQALAWLRQERLRAAGEPGRR
jgi:hypothetical protein